MYSSYEVEKYIKRVLKEYIELGNNSFSRVFDILVYGDGIGGHTCKITLFSKFLGKRVRKDREEVERLVRVDIDRLRDYLLLYGLDKVMGIEYSKVKLVRGVCSIDVDIRYSIDKDTFDLMRVLYKIK